MGEKSSAPARTPAKTPVAAKKTTNASTSSTGKQQSILGFFSKSGTPSSTGASTPAPSEQIKASPSSCLKETTTKSNSFLPTKRLTTLTPVPSSDTAEPLSSQENKDAMQIDAKLFSDSLPSPGSSEEYSKANVNMDVDVDVDVKAPIHSSPSRKVRNALDRIAHATQADTTFVTGQKDRQLRRALRRRRRRHGHAPSGSSVTHQATCPRCGD